MLTPDRINHQVGRLALRVEGDWWVAYYAKPNTMDGALNLGQIRMSIVQDKARKAEFMALMQSAVTGLLASMGMGGAVWPDAPQRAPEHERAGRG